MRERVGKGETEGPWRNIDRGHTSTSASEVNRLEQLCAVGGKEAAKGGM